MSAVAPRLVLAWGNRARGDDALGPLFADRLRALALPGVEVLEDHQLMPEHALDLAGRARVLFADAAAGLAEPFVARTLAPARDRSLASHALSPAALLQVCADLHAPAPPPPAWLLALRAESFELGAPPRPAALAALEAALAWARRWAALALG